MAKSTPIPSFKRPTAMPASAMAAFVSGDSSNAETNSSPPAAGETRVANSASLSESPETSSEVSSDQATVHSIDGKAAKARTKASQIKNGRRLEIHKDGTTSRKVTIYLDPEMDRQLSIHSVTIGVDRSHIIAEALTKFFRHTSS